MTSLHMAPFTCARVTMIALEEAGVAFDTQLVRFMRGEHKSPEFKQLNPTGKVPALVIDGTVLTESREKAPNSPPLTLTGQPRLRDAREKLGAN